MAKPLVSNITVAVSGSGASILAAKYAIIMAKQYKCHLCAVNVVDTGTIQQLYSEKILIDEEVLEYEQCLEANGRRFLSFVEELAAAKGVRIKQYLRRGVIFEEIIHAASAYNSDLLILGSLKKGRSSNEYMSSIYHEISLRSSCSILSVKDSGVDVKYRQL
jgi:nucleotide-binding universal stress UspA family protein